MQRLRKVQPARVRVLDDATRAIEHNAHHGRVLAAEIRDTRDDTRRLANALNAACVLLAGVAGYLVHRQTLLRRALVDAYTKALEERAVELEAFAGRVAHDIRNPLASARLAAELAKRGAEDAERRSLHDRIVRSLSRADAISTALLQFARSGARPDPGARTEAPAVVDEVLADVSEEAQKAGIELTREAPERAFVAAEQGVYLSLLGNLVRNALKYMGTSRTRRIHVRVVDEGETIRTEVTDTGPGISREKQPQLFEPYFRAQSGPEGLGLGLATVKRLADAHGGRVGLQSTPGEGSTFWFVLPKG